MIMFVIPFQCVNILYKQWKICEMENQWKISEIIGEVKCGPLFMITIKVCM